MAPPEGRITAGSHKRFHTLAALCVLGIAVWFLLDSLDATIARAEQQNVKLVLNQVRSALVVKGAEVMLARKEPLTRYQGMNPLPLLGNGSGVANRRCPAALSDSRKGWCFDEGPGWLVYQAIRGLTMGQRTAEPGQPLAWQVCVEYTQSVKNGKNKMKRGVGLTLVEVDHAQVRNNGRNDQPFCHEANQQRSIEVSQ